MLEVIDDSEQQEKSSELEIISEVINRIPVNHLNIQEHIMQRTVPNYPELETWEEIIMSSCPVCKHDFTHSIALMFHLARYNNYYYKCL